MKYRSMKREAEAIQFTGENFDEVIDFFESRTSLSNLDYAICKTRPIGKDEDEPCLGIYASLKKPRKKIKENVSVWLYSGDFLVFHNGDFFDWKEDGFLYWMEPIEDKK